MKVGVHIPQVGGFAKPEVIAPFAQAAEEAGVDSLWVSDHVVLSFYRSIRSRATPIRPTAGWRCGQRSTSSKR